MSTIGERIKQIRDAKEMTQQKFGDIIGIKRNTVATYEIGRNTPMDSVITSICREFDVNETWLRTGEGEMFIPLSRDEKLGQEFAKLMNIDPDNASEGDALKLKLISYLVKLDADSWEVLAEIAKKWNEEK